MHVPHTQNVWSLCLQMFAIYNMFCRIPIFKVSWHQMWWLFLEKGNGLASHVTWPRCARLKNVIVLQPGDRLGGGYIDPQVPQEDATFHVELERLGAVLVGLWLHHPWAEENPSCRHWGPLSKAALGVFSCPASPGFLCHALLLFHRNLLLESFGWFVVSICFNFVTLFHHIYCDWHQSGLGATACDTRLEQMDGDGTARVKGIEIGSPVASWRFPMVSCCLSPWFSPYIGDMKFW